MNKIIYLTILFLVSVTQAEAQLPKSYKAEVEAQAIGTTGGVVPFWMRSNQYGSIPLDGASMAFIGRINKGYSIDSSNRQLYNNGKKLVDWGFGLEARANVGKGSNLQLIEAYVKGKLGIFQLSAGRTKDVMGLNGDTLLSSGNFAISGNALGIPKIEISIPEYWRIPIFGGLFSVKGNFAHGWVGKVNIADTALNYIRTVQPETYFHQKSLYITLGMRNWKFKLYGGFSHQAFWGNEKSIYGQDFDLSPAMTFIYVATGKAYGKAGIPKSKIGNQLGSIDLGAEYEFRNVKVMLYRQNLYDVGALSKLANIADGLNGISVENLNYKDENTGFYLKKGLFEFFYSKNQAGYPWSTYTQSGDEDYYNNYMYAEGWSYKHLGLGTPLITRRVDARPGQAERQKDFFINNRVIALHTGFSGIIKGISFTTKATYSWNFGTFGTSIYGHSTGPKRSAPTSNIFKTVQQFSFYLEGDKKLRNNYKLGAATSFDRGELLNNSFGLQLRASKSFGRK